MNTVLVVAPHPDDETLGCGGTLLRHVAEGDRVHWLLATEMTDAFGAARRQAREQELGAVERAYGFAGVHRAGFPTMQLDARPMSELIDAFGRIFQEVQPGIVYLPYRNDAHSDHAAVFDASAACCKSFRHPSVRRVLAYETLSETEFGLRPDDPGFRPNVFVDIAAQLERKVEVLRLFVGEMGEFPFPRSETCVRALAALRGSQAGTAAAEAFMLLKEIR